MFKSSLTAIALTLVFQSTATADPPYRYAMERAFGWSPQLVINAYQIKELGGTEDIYTWVQVGDWQSGFYCEHNPFMGDYIGPDPIYVNGPGEIAVVEFDTADVNHDCYSYGGATIVKGIATMECTHDGQYYTRSVGNTVTKDPSGTSAGHQNNTDATAACHLTYNTQESDSNMGGIVTSRSVARGP